MARLNYNHLRYFQAVAHDGNLTRTAERMNLSQSALSIQIKKLEEQLGHALFERRNRQLVLTEAGRIALDHADSIFATGDELLGTLSETGSARQVLRIGALATLSRNFQMDFLTPALGLDETSLVLRFSGLGDLLQDLSALNLDLVLTNQLPSLDAGSKFIIHTINQQSVILAGRPGTADPAAGPAALLTSYPVILPTLGNSVRTGFDAMAERMGVRPRIAAEVDDMAMMRLLARTGTGLAVLPAIVIKDELNSGVLVQLDNLDGLDETFYAVTIPRRFPNPLVGRLLDAA